MWAFVIVNVVVVEVLFLSAGSGKNEVLAARFVTTRHYADAAPSRGTVLADHHEHRTPNAFRQHRTHRDAFLGSKPGTSAPVGHVLHLPAWNCATHTQSWASRSSKPVGGENVQRVPMCPVSNLAL
ncbi:hypothetical protein, partial [Streptomyces sp. MB09-02B]|uniref:hypothetical protein n=1 Tax=Streptomyces sp. MB09-02B TaxID=3028667 RepID=UPI0029BABE9D